MEIQELKQQLKKQIIEFLNLTPLSPEAIQDDAPLFGEGLGLDSIEGRLSFFADGRYPDGAEKYTCGIAISITQGGRTGLSMSHVE